MTTRGVLARRGRAASSAPAAAAVTDCAVIAAARVGEGVLAAAASWDGDRL